MRTPLTRSAAACTLVLALACADDPPTSEKPAAESPYDAYLGRYQLSEDVVLVVSDRDGLLTLLRSFWNVPTVFEPVAGDLFRSLLYPEVKLEFHRVPEGLVNELEVSGFEAIAGTASRLSSTERLPVEALLDGEAEEAIRLVDWAEETSPERTLRLARQLLGRFPSQSITAAVFLERVAERFPDSAVVQEASGVAWVWAGERDRALPAFRRAVELDEEMTWSRVALRRLDPGFAWPEEEGWSTPFALADLFSAPTTEEIRQVRQRWRDRDLSPQQVRVEEKSILETNHGVFRQQVVSHLVHGQLHHAAVLVPADAVPGCCPVILDVRGISWDYKPRRVTSRLATIEILRDQARRFVFAVPGLRGEKLEVDGDSYLSEGDRTDGWDGAADDTIALLSAVLEVVPEVDPERAGIWGVSRGASVAMLAAERDPRIDCVSAWMGPADWFGLMGSMGWTFEEQVSDGLRHRWQPGHPGSGSAAQFIEWFLREPIDQRHPSLAEVRRRVAASSPLFFVDTLPPSDLQYGVEDGSVPVANGLALSDRLSKLGRSAPDYQVTIREGVGHRMPYPWAFEQSREFLLYHLVEAP